MLGGGDLARSGAVNLATAPLVLEALESWEEGLLAALLRVETPEGHRNRMLERVIRWYLAVVLVVGVAGFAVWLAATGDVFRSLTVLIAVLVVSCPCASGTAIPLAEEFAVSRLRRWGVFLREGSLWSRLASVRKLLFDKTGTLTLESLGMSDPAALDRLEAEVRGVLLALVERSLHPVAAALRENLLARNPGLLPAAGVAVQEVIGSGLEGRNGSRLWRLGRPGWAVESGVTPAGRCVLACDGVGVAGFDFREEVRQDAAAQVGRFVAEGLEVHLLSGDEPAKVQAMAEALGIPAERAHGGMSPADKGEWVAVHDARDTLMIGDGANDTIAFERAWCRGTPAVDRGLLERKADFYFLGRSLAGIGMLFRVARARRRTILRVFGFAVAYNLFAVTLALAGRMNPLLAAVLMPASSMVSILIVLHGTRLRALGAERA